MTDINRITGKKTGRPTTDPKTHDLRVRVNDRMYSQVMKYSKEHDQTMTDTIRECIDGYLKET